MASQAATLAAEVQRAAADPKRRFNRFILLAEVGRGGMAAVYRAWDPNFERQVALKILSSKAVAGDRDALARFRTEGEAAGRLNHQAIVRVFDHGEERGQPYIVMAYIDGTTLKSKLENECPTLEVVRICKDIARGLHYAHSQGLIHRDVKPSNILVSKDGHPFLTDFGLVKLTQGDGNLTRFGRTVGTPLYMAPEQAMHGKTAGPLADVYSLGMILYFGACRRAPWDYRTQGDLMIKAVKEPATPPTRWNPEVPRDLEQIIMACLGKEPEERYESAEALANDLQRFLDGDPIVGTLRLAEISPEEEEEEQRRRASRFGKGSAIRRTSSGRARAPSGRRPIPGSGRASGARKSSGVGKAPAPRRGSASRRGGSSHGRASVVRKGSAARRAAGARASDELQARRASSGDVPAQRGSSGTMPADRSSPGEFPVRRASSGDMKRASSRRAPLSPSGTPPSATRPVPTTQSPPASKRPSSSGRGPASAPSPPAAAIPSQPTPDLGAPDFPHPVPTPAGASPLAPAVFDHGPAEPATGRSTKSMVIASLVIVALLYGLIAVAVVYLRAGGE